MWHRLKNLCFSLNTYQVLRPDFKVRQQVNRALGDRPALSADEWFAAFYQSQGIAYAVAIFAYHYLEKYSGLAMSQVQPADRLDKDLHWTEVCWFDWESQLCHDVQQQFGIDISECLSECLSEYLDGCNPFTIGELVAFLDQTTSLLPISRP